MNRKQAIVAMLASTLPFTKLHAWDGGDPQQPSQAGGLVHLSRRVKALEESSQASDALLQQIQATLQTHANRIQAVEQAVAALQGNVSALQGAVTSLQDAQASIVGFTRDGSRLVLEHPGGIRLEGLDVRLSAVAHLELEGMVVKTNAGAQARTTAPLILLN